MAQDSSFVHPKGTKVPAVVHTAVYQKSQAGNHMIKCTFRVTGGPNAGKGQPIRFFLMLDRDTGVQQITNLGVTHKELAALEDMQPEDAFPVLAEKILSRACLIDIEQEDYQERKQNRVKWVHALPAAAARPAAKAKTPEPEPEEMPDEEEDELTRLRRQLAAKEAEKPRRSAPPVDDDDDELPF